MVTYGSAHAQCCPHARSYVSVSVSVSVSASVSVSVSVSVCIRLFHLPSSDITFSQFISNLSDYLINGTTLIFSLGNEYELAVENVHSFSMFVWPGSSSKAVITCHGHNGRFEGDANAVADAGFLEGGFCYNNAHEMFRPRPHFVETTPIFEREASYSVNPFVFDRDLC